jgi:uncharacterized protein YndB with AHSA1/START domain
MPAASTYPALPRLDAASLRAGRRRPARPPAAVVYRSSAQTGGTVRLERDIVIERPVDEVFAYVSEPANLPSWQPAVVEIRRPEGPLAVGSSFGETRTFVGKRFETTVEVVELEPERTFAIRVVGGPVPIRVRHVFGPADGGTRVTIAGEVELHGALRVAGRLMAKAAEHDAGASLVRLKALLERGDEGS